MNVLFVSIKERTNEIGILKALARHQDGRKARRYPLLYEFLPSAGGLYRGYFRCTGYSG
jgi:hypothetical protein